MHPRAAISNRTVTIARIHAKTSKSPEYSLKMSTYLTTLNIPINPENKPVIPDQSCPKNVPKKSTANLIKTSI
jgi:hypothetical protein